MISLNNITFEFGGRALYRDANWHIKPNERIGLIGMNGTGKSTLLRMIHGEYKPSNGSISRPKDLTIGFFNQDQLSFETDASILQVTMSAFQRQLDLEVEIEKILKVMETDYSDDVLNKLSDLQTEFDALDGYNIHHKCEKVLEGLGFTTAQLQQPYKKFSGGWRMRVMLAKLLLQNPKLLMLDEPTNHLDLPTIEWLENYLQSYDGTVIVVSHDREFLDKMITKTVEVANQKITEYAGNYSYYLSAKDERADLQQRQFDNQQQFIKQQEAFINRFKAKASKATAAQSRVKLLDKLDRIEAPEDDNREININFKMSTQSGKVVIEVDHATKTFPDVRIVTNAVGKIERGDKIALIGANGKGKSTLLRMIANVEPFEGKIERGHNVVEAFYAQHQLESLNVENEILQEMQQYAGERTDTELRTLLGCFLFTGDEVFKKIKVLSGGEKARVALSRTLLAEANFMLLDEPTNHLDIRSINILIQAMQQYQGTFIVVSHDRFFVTSVANKIWWIENEELKEYPGTFAEFEQWRKRIEDEKLKAEKLQPTKKAEKAIPVFKEEKPKQQPSNKKNQIQQLQKRIGELEQTIHNLKLSCAKTELQFADMELMKDTLKALALNKQYEEDKKRLSDMQKQYDQIFLELMELEENG
jgi:ATP-binding cassette subfamily F protein 3